MGNSDSVDQHWAQALTRRETEVVLLVATGMSNQEIAQRLRLNVGTIKLHVHHILRKAGARSRTELVAQMIRRSSAARSRDARKKIAYLRWLRLVRAR